MLLARAVFPLPDVSGHVPHSIFFLCILMPVPKASRLKIAAVLS